MKRTAKYYSKNADARRKKLRYDKEFQKRPKQVKKRVEANRANRKAGTYGNGDGKDYDHAVGRMVSESTNRGRKGEGGRKKKVTYRSGGRLNYFLGGSIDTDPPKESKSSTKSPQEEIISQIQSDPKGFYQRLSTDKDFQAQVGGMFQGDDLENLYDARANYFASKGRATMSSPEIEELMGGRRVENLEDYQNLIKKYEGVTKVLSYDDSDEDDRVFNSSIKLISKLSNKHKPKQEISEKEQIELMELKKQMGIDTDAEPAENTQQEGEGGRKKKVTYKHGGRLKYFLGGSIDTDPPKKNLRPDGSEKGKGFFGDLEMSDDSNMSATEMTVGVNVDGQDIDIPLINPLLSKEQIDYLLSGGDPTDEIVDRAVDFAMERKSKGLPFYATKEEEGSYLLPVDVIPRQNNNKKNSEQDKFQQFRQERAMKPKKKVTYKMGGKMDKKKSKGITYKDGGKMEYGYGGKMKYAYGGKKKVK